ncbi:hypothetical protein [Alkalicoccobacillus plakortidis]|uniref:ABC-type transport system involved in multi-copper enzyme maturation, permease component n=1 Tax=Alkalicoccobacillus plakortidis TaxID=444060 RepID=A0ABT0XNB5_9BACI|nr:hypothetical protein [Alkalicoccobacillus plakortidis]MCM2677404.1 hypothetical protein [Alkalicoccobacillus plakortidis]
MLTVELKKLFQPLLLLVALMITIVYYNQQLNFIHTYWPNGGLVPIYDHASDWQDRFGQSLEKEDIAVVEDEYLTLVEQADNILLENAIAEQLELKNYADFESWYKENLPSVAINEMDEDEKEIVEKIDAIQQDLIDYTGQSIEDKIVALQTLYLSIEQFDSSDTFLMNEHYTVKEREILSANLFMEEGWRNILPTYLSSTVSGYFESILTLLIFLLSLLISSVFVRDRLLGLQKLQWSSRHGRNILWTQFVSGMIASFLLITCIVGLFWGLLYLTDFTQYFSNGLNSFFIRDDEPLLVSLFQWTFGEWIIKLVLLVYLIGMAYSGILIFLSQTSKHYLSLLMKIIPVGFIFIAIANRVFKDAFYLKNDLYQWTNISLVELYVGILLFVLCIGLPIIYCIHQRNKDLVN